jgi:hypothetical protein
MATIELIGDTMTGKFTLTPEEALDIRKHALECACRIAQEGRHQEADINYLLMVAKKFEFHLARDTGNG